MARTMRRVELYEQERQALAVLVQAQWQVIMVRGQINSELEDEATEHDAYVRGVEAMADAVNERVENIAKAHALGTKGATLELLDRINNYATDLEARLGEWRLGE